MVEAFCVTQPHGPNSSQPPCCGSKTPFSPQGQWKGHPGLRPALLDTPEVSGDGHVWEQQRQGPQPMAAGPLYPQPYQHS